MHAVVVSSWASCRQYHFSIACSFLREVVCWTVLNIILSWAVFYEIRVSWLHTLACWHLIKCWNSGSIRHLHFQLIKSLRVLCILWVFQRKIRWWPWRVISQESTRLTFINKAAIRFLGIKNRSSFRLSSEFSL